MTWWIIHHHYGPIQKKNICIPPATIRSQTKWTNWNSQQCHTKYVWDEKSEIRIGFKTLKVIDHWSWLDCHWFFYRAWLNQNHAKRVNQRGFQATYSLTGNTKLSFPKTSCLLKMNFRSWIESVIHFVFCSHFQCKVQTAMWIQFSKLDIDLIRIINCTFTLWVHVNVSEVKKGLLCIFSYCICFFVITENVHKIP